MWCTFRVSKCVVYFSVRTAQEFNVVLIGRAGLVRFLEV